MKAALPCDYCGCIGYHMWAGSGNCPGAMGEGERKGAEVNEIQGELERRLGHLEQALQRQDNAIIELKGLLSRAADALEDLSGPGWKRELIAELRKVAE